MRQWKLGPSDPLSLTLAADARLTYLDYANDQIWELLLGRGDPAAVLLQTTYGLRARNMRVFPLFVEEHNTISDPADFDIPPTINKFFPNYLQLIFSPFPGIDVQMEYWVPNCQTIAGRIHIKNSGVTDRRIRLEWASRLSPSGGGRQMLPEKKEAVTVLAGQTEDLFPVMFITGGAEGVSSPYPSLNHNLNLSPGASRRFTWVLASLENEDESFRVARHTATLNWEAKVVQIEMTNTHQVDVYTGDPDWDAAFAFGQKVARSLIYTPSHHLPNHSFVSTRQPDHGFSRKGDGTDYNYLWNGQSALDTWYLSGLLLPGAQDLAKGLLLNFLATQEENWRIDWKPGLAGQRSQMLATPILVSLAWRIYQYTEDRDFLEKVFRPLLEFVHTWFDNRQDRDGDGIPEWDNLIQTGFDDNPSFSRWHSWAQGADITLVESPDLCAYLYREIKLLIKIAQVLEYPEPASSLEAFADNLHGAVEASWDARRATYQYWDRETHQSYKGEVLKQRKGPGELLLDIILELPARILLRLESEAEIPSQAQASIHGRLPGGQHRVERIGQNHIQWIEGISTTTIPNLYADLEHVHVEGLPSSGKTSVRIIDLRKEDHTLLVPLWAGIPDQSRAEKIIQRKLSKPTQYHRSHGIPACHKTPKHPEAAICQSVWLPWNVMVGEGLLAYGARSEAVDLMSRLMTGIIGNLKREHAFRTHYHADLPQSLGERNALTGLPPIGLFLDILGVRILSPWRVYLHGLNPFPWPVKLKFRGLTVECETEETNVIFPDGQNIAVTDPTPCLVINDSIERE